MSPCFRRSLLLVAWSSFACEERQHVVASPGPASLANAPSLASVSAAQASSPLTPLVVSSDTSFSGLGIRSGSIERASLWGFTELRVDLKRIRLEISAETRGVSLDKLLPKGALAVVNGGYFEANFRPSAWVRSRGSELAPKSDTSKGGVLAVQGERQFIGPLSLLSFDPEFAIQSFPLIVERNGSPGIHRDDGRRAARTVVCLVGDQLHFVLIAAPRGEGPTLFESVALLHDPPPLGFGCRTALNLDGGPSSGVVFADNVAAKQRLPLAPVGYGIAMLPRP